MQRAGLLGEFVVGRFLHKYKALINQDLFKSIEVFYKKRVILEELFDIVRTTNILVYGNIISSGVHSLFKNKASKFWYILLGYMVTTKYIQVLRLHNLAFALEGYKKALEEIITNDKELISPEAANNKNEGPITNRQKSV